MACIQAQGLVLRGQRKQRLQSYTMGRAQIDATAVIGRAPEELSIAERFAFAGKWVALERYSPQTLPLRTIEAIGSTVTECVEQLRSRGADPAKFEFIVLTPPY